MFLAVLAERFFGYHFGRRQWLGVTVTAAGLAVIGLTATAEGPQRSSLAALVAARPASWRSGSGW
jgi:drug/metabolite transporter (DMT)-like permease